MATATTPDALHGEVDRVIRRQQGRLLGELREKRVLTPQIERIVCWFFSYCGQDIHKAISGNFTEAAHDTPEAR